MIFKLINGILLIACALTIQAMNVKANGEARIIGGEVTDIISHGYLVSLRYRDQPTSPYRHKCAGVIYAPKVVVTAAQCVLEIASNDRVMVVAGANTRTGVDGMMYPVANWSSHSGFDNWLMDWDVGILIMAQPFDLTDSILRTIAIRPNRPADGKKGTIAGWGYREEFGPSSFKLESTQVPIVSTEECTAAYGVGELTARMICAGYLQTGGKDACQGDTGGPLVIEDELIGLVSWGRGCARPGYPGVYTFATAVKEWIDNTIAKFP